MLLALIAAGLSQSQDYRSDLSSFIDALKTNGAYVKEDKIDLEALRAAYLPKFAKAKTKSEVLHLVEDLVGELHDFHASLGANDGSSPRLVPSGADVIGHWANNHAIVDQVRFGSLAEQAGVRASDEVVSINGKPTRQACTAWFGVRKPDQRAWDWALNSALAGRWDVPRRLSLRSNGSEHEVSIATPLQPNSKVPLTIERREGAILYLRPENSLGDNELITAFDQAVPAMRAAKKLVIDLRNTPSGGSSTVARGIMGLFVSKRLPFQRHRVLETETGTVRDWVEYATPRLSKPITARLAILVDRWTGSMGEGIAVGFDGMRRGIVVGTPMAQLRGAVDRLDLPVSGIGVRFPTEQVFHINGTPRHNWLPPFVVVPSRSKSVSSANDPWWTAAKKVLE